MYMYLLNEMKHCTVSPAIPWHPKCGLTRSSEEEFWLNVYIQIKWKTFRGKNKIEYAYVTYFKDGLHII